MLLRLSRMVLLLVLLPVIANAQGFQTRATAAYVLDHSTGTVLLAKNADTPLPPASMSKLMTVYMAFEAISNGTLDINERLPVSTHSAAYGGSTMFLDTTDRVTVEDLLRGVIILSGNDASSVLAETMSTDGTEAGFARQMTARAKQLGMMNSTFANSNGWPAAGHRMSMADLGQLSSKLIREYPTFYPLFSEKEFLFDGRASANSQNRNPLLGLGIGADGLKTGHTNEAGYGLVGSAKRGERRIVFAITGMQSSQERAAEAERVVNWAFRQFAQRDVIDAGTQVTKANVWMGAEPLIGLDVASDLSLLVPVANLTTGLEAEVIYDDPIPAPITKGTPLGKMRIKLDGLPTQEVVLVADRDVAAGGFGTKVRTAAQVISAWLRGTPTEPSN